MIKVFKSENSNMLYIETVTEGHIEDFRCIRNGDLFTIDRVNTSIIEVSNYHYSNFRDYDNNTFSSANDFEDYMNLLLIVNLPSFIITTSIVAKTYKLNDYVNADASDLNYVADLIELSDGTYVDNSRVKFQSHGFNIGNYYFLDNSGNGTFTDTVPTSGISQRLFYVVDSDYLLVNVSQAVDLSATTPSTPLINDQTSNGYMDIGTMRMSWGSFTSTSDGLETFTFPQSFATGSTPNVVLTRTVAQSNVSSSLGLFGEATETSFQIDRDNGIDGAGETFNWQAIGLKP